jgi:putative CocE/NonD family hydrolase
MRHALFGLFATAVLAPLLRADDPAPFDVAAHYTKFEYRIPMRDGAHLFTAVYVPKDESKPYPFFVTRTPYSAGPYGEDHYPPRLGPSREFDEAGYIFVVQDVRGRYESEGAYDLVMPHIDNPTGKQTDESTDMYDTVEWLLHNVPNNNGRVGVYGVSYNGFYAEASIIDSHPAIKACSPQAPVTDFYMSDDWYHNGAFMLDAAFDFFLGYKPVANPTLPPKSGVPFDYGTADSYEFFLRAGSLADLDERYMKHGSPFFTLMLEHTSYDAFWQARDISRHLHNVHCAVLNVGGLFDAEDISGPVKTFHAIERMNPGATDLLVEGPWVHGGFAGRPGASIGNVRFASKTSEFFRSHIQFPFFEQYLKDGPDAHLPKAYVFETGTNVWRRYDSWPPKNAQLRTLYFQRGGGLAFEKPSGAEGPDFDEYVSDPKHPVPPVGYAYGPAEGGGSPKVPKEYMVSDQRFAAKRPDVLVYQTQPLDEDVTVAGPVQPKLFVSTSGTDSDWVVKLIDVYPADTAGEPPGDSPDVPMPAVTMGDYEQLVRGEPMRGKFRKGFDNPEAFTPGKVEEVDFSMPDVNHTFRRGHRIMVQVQSSWFPVTDLNPQTFTDIPTAKPEQFQKATERVYHSEAAPSGILLGTLGPN